MQKNFLIDKWVAYIIIFLRKNGKIVINLCSSLAVQSGLHGLGLEREITQKLQQRTLRKRYINLFSGWSKMERYFFHRYVSKDNFIKRVFQ